MTFLAVGWLALLVPWAILVAWLWRRTADERATTASFLWRYDDQEPSQRRALRRRPPMSVLAALLAMLATILALADPAIAGRRARVTIVVDAHLSLAAEKEGRTLRDRLLDHVRAEIDRARVATTMTFRTAGVREEQPDRFTARSTADALRATVASALGDGDATVVLTDRPFEVADERLVLMSPVGLRDNVGIETAIAVSTSKPSLMVRIANDSDRSTATLRVRSGEWSTQQSVSLAPRGEAANVFTDLPPTPAEEIEVRLVELNDELPVDDRATLLRTGGWPTLQLEGALPGAATRFAAAYTRARGSDRRAAATVAITSQPREEPTSPQLILADANVAAAGPLGFADHPILNGLNLNDSPLRARAPAPAGDWVPIAWLGDAPILCVRESPRAVWAGLSVASNDLRSVVLMSNAIDWLSLAAPAEWRGEPPDSIGQDWRAAALLDQNLEASPGRYVDGSGRAVAVNVPAVVGPRAASRGEIAHLLRRLERDAARSLRGPLAIAAASLAFIAALLARPRRQS